MENKTNFLELFKLINKIETYGDENIEFEFSFNEFSKKILIKNSELFDEGILVDDIDYTINKLPETGNIITTYTHPLLLLKYASIEIYANIEELYNNFIFEKNRTIGASCNITTQYLILDNSPKGASLLTFQELPQKVNDILENKLIIQYLKQLADYEISNNL